MAGSPSIWRWRFWIQTNISNEMIEVNEKTKGTSHDRNNWAKASGKIIDTNTLWRQYVILADLYRFYVDLAWKVSVWYYTAVGVSLIYFFDHLNAKNPGYLPLLLLFLTGLSGGLLTIFASTFRHLIEMGNWLEYIARSLHLPGRPHIEFILSFFKLTCALLFIIVLACIGLFAFIYINT